MSAQLGTRSNERFVKRTYAEAKGRESREENLNNLRKEKREEALNKRRTASIEANVSNVGNRQRDPFIMLLLRIFAKSDFKHDFGEGDKGRDLITKSDRQRFQEMLSGLPVKQRVDYLNRFDAMFPPRGNVAINLYTLLGGTIDRQLYPDAPEEHQPSAGDYIDEPGVMAKMDLNYEGLKTEIRSVCIAADGVTSTNTVYERDYAFRATHKATPEASTQEALPRSYTVRAQRYKNADNTTRNLASLFKDVTGGSTQFALLVDAASGLSLSSILDASLGPDPGIDCAFAFIKNVEADADSATGVSNVKPVAGPATPASLTTLRDVDTSTVVFPIWNRGGLNAEEAENLFTRIQVILNRVENGEIEASVLINEDSHTFPDVGTTSNVKNASLNGLAALFARNILAAADRRPADERKPYIYALLKRMGDWCQALSLLDRTRVYTPVDKDGVPTGSPKRTLQDLITDGYEVGIVTNDRILLTYALFLGLNVFFTSASDLGCLVYFKNKDDLPNAAAIEKRTADIEKVFISMVGGAPTEDGIRTMMNQANQVLMNLHPTSSTFEATKTAVIETVKANLVAKGYVRPPGETGPGVIDGLAKALASKVFLSNIGDLRTNFNEIGDQMIKALRIYSAPKDASNPAQPKEKFDAITNLVNLMNKYKTDVDHNREVITRLAAGRYAKSYATDEAIFVDLGMKMNAGGRMSTSELMSRAKNTLLSIGDDLKQISQKKRPQLYPVSTLSSAQAAQAGQMAAAAAAANDNSFLTRLEEGTYIPSLPTEAVRDTANPTLKPRPNDKDISNFGALYGPLPSSALVGGARNKSQRGGSLPVSLTQRQVFPYKSAKLETTVNRLSAIASGATVGDAATASAQLSILDSLPVARIGDYYRDEKCHPYSVIDMYLITKEDLPALEEELEGLPTAAPDDPDRDFYTIRYALLYHDILYDRLQRIFDEPGVEFVGRRAVPTQPGVDGEILQDQKPDTEVTPAVAKEFIAIRNEAAFLRYAISSYFNAGANIQIKNTIAKQMMDVRRDGIDPDALTALVTASQGGEVTILNAIRNIPIENAQLLSGALQSAIRYTLFQIYTPVMPSGYIPAPTDTATLPQAFKADDVNAFIESEGAASITVEDDDDNELGGGGLQLAAPVQANAGVGSSSSGVLPQGRRRGLYARLRQRAGEGTTPGVRNESGGTEGR